MRAPEKVDVHCRMKECRQRIPNALTMTSVHPMAGFDEAHFLALATLASSDGGQDPVDGSIRAAAASKLVRDAPQLITFVPFDPEKKTSEANTKDSSGVTPRIVKGAFSVYAWCRSSCGTSW
jgi:H+-transporting ATPase